MNDYKIQLGALLDANAKGDLQKQAEAIKDLAVTISKLNLDQSAINSLKSQLTKNGIDINLVFGNTNQLQNQAKQIGKTVGQLISDNADRAISNVSSKSMGEYFKIDPSTSDEFKREMEGLVSNWTKAKGQLTDIKIDTRTSFDKKAEENITRLHQATVTYKNELDEVIKKTIAWRQIGTNKNANGEEKALHGFVEVAGQYSKSLDTASVKTDNFISQQKKLVGQLSNSLSSIQSGYLDQSASKPIKSQNNIGELSKQYQVVENAITNVGNATKSTFTDMEVEAKRQISILQNMVKEYRNAENVSTKLKGTDLNSGLSIAGNDLEKFKADAKDFPQITKTVNDLNNALSKVGDAASLNTFNDQLRVARSELSKVKSETVAINRDEKVGINVSGLESKIADIQRISPEINSFKTQINGAEVSVESLLSDLSKINTQGDFSVVNSKFKAFTDSAKATGIAVTETSTAQAKLATELQKTNAITGYQKYMANNTKITKKFKNQILEWIHTIESVDDLTRDDLNNIFMQFKKLDSEMRSMGKLGLSFGDSIKKGIGSFTQWVSATTIVMGAVTTLKKMGSAVYDIDTAMTNLYKVTDETDSKYNQFLDEANEKAQKLGRSVSSLVTQSAEWAKLGFSIDDSVNLAGVSSIYANVGEVDDVTAVSDLVTTMKALNIESKNAIGIVDELNNLSNNYAVTAAGLGEGLTNSASALALQGNSLEQILALLTGGGEITQNVGELGNMLKVASLRLASMKGELEEIGESYEDITSVSKNQTQIYNLTKGQVDILDEQNNALKDTYTILEEVAGAWEDVEALDKSSLLELMFGKQRANQGAAIISAFQSGQVQKALEDANNSVGSAMEEQKKWMESLEAKTKQFEASFESLSQTVLDSNFLKSIVDFGTDSVNVLDTIIDKFGVLIPILTGTSITAFIKNFDHLKDLGILQNAIETIGKSKDSMNVAFNAISELDKANKVAALSTSLLSKEQKLGILMSQGLSLEEARVALATAALSASQKKATTSTLGLGKAFKGLGAKLKSFVLAHPILTAIAAIGLLTKVYIKWGNTVANASKKAKESLEEYQKTVEDIKSLNDELSTTVSKIDELNAKENLTLVEIDELEKLRETNDELERELSIRKALEKQQGKKANDDALDYFNKKSTYGTSAGGIDISGNQIEILDYQLKKIKELDEYFKTADASNKDFLYVNNEKLLASLKEQTAKTIGEFMEMDDALVDGMDDGVISLLNDIYDRYSESIGTFGETQTEKISGILAKADFEKYNDTLMELGKEGKLSINELSSQFPDLISYLQEAEVSAEELYKYIMSLSNPDAINYDEVRKQLMGSVGIDGNVDSAYEAKLLDKLNKSGLTGNEGLEAYLQVKAKYTDGQTEFWSIDDWITNIQAEMSSLEESNETPILSVSDTIDQLNTQLRPAFESLGKAYQEIFTTEDGKEIFTPENVDISMLSDIKSAIEEINEIDGIDIDISSFEDLANVLTDSSSTAGEVKTSFNDLANTIIYATDCTNMSSDTFNVLSKSLESMGLTNADKILHNIAQAQEEITAQGYTLADITAEQAKQFINEGKASAIATEYLQMYMIQKQLADYPLNTLNDVAALESLCNALGVTGELLKAVISLKSALGAVDSGAPIQAFQSQIDSANAKIADLAASGGSFKFNFDGAGKASAGKAGKEAADAYLEAFEKELSKLDDLKNRGKITEKQYIDSLRRLYQKYFAQKEKYLDQFEKYEHQYLNGMKSLYESAFSYITKQIDKRIDALQKQSDAQVESLEAQKKASEEFYQSQIDEIDDQIDAIDKEIKAKQELIDTINDAADARQREIDLQKAQYDLERMQNQNTQLVYKDGQMIYEADTSGIRDAREEVEDKKRDIEIATIEKVIDGLEKQKDLLEERREALEKALDASNAYWDAQIEQTEKHFDSLISNLEETKSKFEELGEVFENAKLEATLQELGINMEALLSGSTEEFDKLKNSYIGILADMGRGNDEVIGQLSKLAGVNAESVSYLESTKGAFENLGAATLDPLSSSVEDTASVTEGLSTSASEASTAVGDIGTNASNTTASITPLNDELQKLKDLLSELTTLFNSLEFPTPGDDGYAQKLEAIATAFGNIATKCKEFEQIDFSSIIGTGGESEGLASNAEGSTGSGFTGLATAISDAVTTIDEQMNNLTTALQIGNDAFAEQIGFITDEYIPAWEELQTRLTEIIGVGGGGDNKNPKDETGNSDGESSGGDNIIGIMQTGGEEVSAKLQDPWLTSFNDFATGENSIQSIAELIKEIVTKMATSIQSQCESAAKAIRNLANEALNSSSILSIDTGGHGGGGSSRSPNTRDYQGTVGSAFASGTSEYVNLNNIPNSPITGYKGLPKDEKNALRSEYGQPELTVYPNGTTELTTEPVMSDLPKGTVVFNEEQTNRIMNNKGEVLGNAYAEGTKSYPPNIVPVNWSDPKNENLRKFNEYLEKNANVLDTVATMKNPLNDIADSVSSINRVVTNNVNSMRNIEINIGDIQLHGVQNASGLADAIITRLPNMLAQEWHRRY